MWIFVDVDAQRCPVNAQLLILVKLESGTSLVYDWRCVNYGAPMCAMEKGGRAKILIDL